MELPPSYFALPFILQSTVWRILMRPFFNLFARFEVHGLENLKGLTRPVIFAPNHSSELDSILLPLALPIWSHFAPVFYIVRESSFYSDPIFGWRGHLYAGWIFRMFGAYSIVSGVKDYAVSLAVHVKILKDSGSICIFPEGGFTKNGEIGTAHGGVGYLAFAAQCPAVPVLISGTFRTSMWGILTGRNVIKITFLPAISPAILPTKPNPEDFRHFGNAILSALKDAQIKQPGFATL